MGRPRTPTAILDAKGAFIKNPQRRRLNEPDGGKPLGGPPKHLTEFQRELWKEVERDIPYGVARKSDRHAFESLVRLKECERLGNIPAAARGQLMTLYAHFGLTPSSRSKVSVPQKPKSALSEFLNKKNAVREVL